MSSSFCEFFWKLAAREGPAYGSKWNCSFRQTVWRFGNKERFGKVCVRHLKCCCWVLSSNVSIAEHNLCDRLYSRWPKCSCFWVLTTIHTPWRYYVRSTRNVMPIRRSLKCLPRAYFILYSEYLSSHFCELTFYALVGRQRLHHLRLACNFTVGARRSRTSLVTWSLCGQRDPRTTVFNLLSHSGEGIQETRHKLFHLKTQPVPRSKHFSSLNLILYLPRILT